MNSEWNLKKYQSKNKWIEERMKYAVKIFVKWLPLAAAITGLCGIIYLAGQQNYRLNLYYPQVQVAEDGAKMLENGRSTLSVVQTEKVNISESLALFTTVYNAKREVVASSAILDGQTPTVPDGVFDYVDKTGEDRITWQPKEGVRIATIVTKYKDGYVLAGRNMREGERLIDHLGWNMLIGWAVTMVVTFSTLYITKWKRQ